jgi:hypothetical protein
MKVKSKWVVSVAVLLCCFCLTSAVWAQVLQSPYRREVSSKPIAQESVVTPVRTAGAGAKVVAEPSLTPPQLTKEQAALRAREFAEADRTGPTPELHMAPMTTPEERGPEAPEPSLWSPETIVPSQFKIYRDTALTAAELDGGYGNSSFTMEPSTGISGKNEFQTGNWYATYSYNSNVAKPTWNYLNPYTIFGSGFCCDQVTVYDAEWDRQFWVLLMNGTLVVASAPSTKLTDWCYYSVDATWFGQPSTTTIDYNDMAISKDYLYLASNLYPSAGGSFGGIVRLPILPMTTCGGFSYNYFYDPSWFTFKPVQGATNTMYWGSNWGPNSGSSFKVYSWPESTGSVSANTYTIDAFNFELRNNGQNCGSTDGKITSWCNYGDSRVLGGYLANGVLGFSFNATQGSGYPFPYARLVYFNPSSNSYLGYNALWGNWTAYQYATFAPNANGDIGGAFAWGGGTTTDYYPGTGYMIIDDFSPTQPWQEAYEIWGAGNTCTYNGILRWGDYLTTRPDYPAGYAWAGTGYAIAGGNCGATGAYSAPHSVVFGRDREASDVTRWDTK